MKKNINSRVSDALVLFFCLTGSVISLWLFWTDLNATLLRLNEKPVASITFKYKVSQRKFIDRFVWDRLQQNSPLYNGDTIRTADSAQASIHFEDNNVLELGPNSMIQIFADTSGTSINLQNGDLFIDSLAAQNNIVLRSGNSAVTLEAGATLQAAVKNTQENSGTEENAKLTVQLISGQAEYSADGATQTLREGAIFVVDSAGTVQEQKLTVTYPLTQTRFLKQTGETFPVLFVWENTPLQTDSAIVLETSKDKNFVTIDDSLIFAQEKTVTLDIGAGTTYWRMFIRSSDEKKVLESIVSGRIQIVAAPAPQVIVPALNDTFTYRTKLPQVRFMWNGNEYASSYIFEVADNPSMENPIIKQRTPQTSSIVSLLSVGIWYWRVTPVYAGVTEAISSRISSFTIVKQGDLRAPELTMPLQNSFVNTEQTALAKKPILFSWKHEPEAASYTVRFAKNEALTEGVIERRSFENWLQINTKQVGITKGRWYWAVTLTDSEGNISPVSAVRTFTAAEGELVFNTVFPPEGYVIAENRLGDTRFTWKKNFDDAVRFQISPTNDFTTLTYDELLPSQIASTQGKPLTAGQWYWRLAAQTPDGKISQITSAKRFSVFEPLNASTIISPQENERIGIKPNQPLICTWQPVVGADYYQVVLYKNDSDSPQFQQRVFGESSATIASSFLQDGSYRLTIQAFAEETPTSSKRNGILSAQTFLLKKSFPLELVSPAANAIFDGFAARLTPSHITWNARGQTGTAAQSELFIAQNKNDLPKKYGEQTTGIVYSKKNPAENTSLPPLKAGTYWWTITAQTPDGFDFSAETPRMFTVNPIPPLPASSGLRPESGTVFDAAYLSKSLQATLTWQAVTGADYFELSVKRVEKNSPAKTILHAKIKSDTLFYTIQDLSLIDEGDFLWTVEAFRLAPDGDILQTGVLASATFSVKLPTLPHIMLKKPEVLYGN